MNKKTYISPETTCISISVANMIAASPTGGNVYDTQAAENSAGFSRDGGFWDDEE